MKDNAEGKETNWGDTLFGVLAGIGIFVLCITLGISLLIWSGASADKVMYEYKIKLGQTEIKK